MKNRLLYILVLGTVVLLAGSCKKYLTVEPEGVVLEENHYQTAADAITTMNGLYGLMLPLVDQLFVTGELRGDLVVQARGSDKNLAEFTNNMPVSRSNPYADYSNFYKLVISCNRALTGLDEILRKDPVNYNRTIYLSNKAEVYYIRAWTYLQLVKIWGDVPFITGSITTVDQIKNLSPEKREVIIKSILKDAEANFSTLLTITNTGLSQTDKMLTFGQFYDISARCLLADLYVHDKNYPKAWEVVSVFSPTGYNGDPPTAGGVMGMYSGQWTEWHNVYDRFNVNNILTQVGLSINFDATRRQTNNLMRWTSNKDGGVYAIKPSAVAINNWKTAPMTLQQYQTTAQGYFVNDNYIQKGFGFEVLDDAGNAVQGGVGDYIRGDRGSYIVSGTDTIIFKYLVKNRGIFKTPVDKYGDNDAFYNIYTEGSIYLLMCEIVNNMGLPNQALIYLNGGMYYANLYKSTRYRVGVMPFKLDKSPGAEDAVKQVNKFILQESAMELAFEGHRWYDLVRFAERDNNPALLADIVAKKYPAGQQAEVKARLMNKASWYLPVK